MFVWNNKTVTAIRIGKYSKLKTLFWTIQYPIVLLEK